MTLLQVVLGLIFLGVLVVIHECGHFIAAKLVGVRVLVFSVGFGRRLIYRKWGNTEYRISAIPFGGYVKMEGDEPSDEKLQDISNFYSRSVWERIFIAAAGPLMNFVFAFAALWLIFMIGVHSDDKLVITAFSTQSPAQRDGLRLNDRILKIDGEEMFKWEDVSYKVATHKNRPLLFEINKDGHRFSFMVTPNDSGEVRATLEWLILTPCCL